MKYEHVAGLFFNKPLALMPAKLHEVSGILLARMAGGLHRAFDGGEEHTAPVPKVVAVIPVFGIIAQRMDMLSESSGGTSTERLVKTIRRAVDDPEVGGIILNVDSPGGDVYGTHEAAEAIYSMRGKKSVVAVSNSLMASAAYWLASAADEIVVTPSGEVGSIGVWMVHMDYSGHLEQEGIKPTLISAGTYKVEGNKFEALGKEAQAFEQSRVDEYYEMFVDAVARNRGTTVEAVKSGYGEGRVLGAKDAVAAGLADRVATFDEVVADMVAQVQSEQQGEPNRAAGRGARDRRLQLEQRI